MNDDQLYKELYARMDKGEITWSEMLDELSLKGFKFGINEGIAR